MSSPELRTVLSNLTIPAQYKEQLLDTLLEGKVTADSRALIGEAAEHTRGRSVDTTLDRYAQWTAQWRQRLIAVARVAIQLTERQRGRLIAALEGVCAGTRFIWMSSSILA
jgi:F-type H+-transporting ATPase subunit delta